MHKRVQHYNRIQPYVNPLDPGMEVNWHYLALRKPFNWGPVQSQFSAQQRPFCGLLGSVSGLSRLFWGWFSGSPRPWVGHAQTVLFLGPFLGCLTILGFSRLFRFGTVGAVWVFSKVVKSGFGAPCLGLSWDSPRPFLGRLGQTFPDNLWGCLFLGCLLKL